MNQDKNEENIKGNSIFSVIKLITVILNSTSVYYPTFHVKTER